MEQPSSTVKSTTTKQAKATPYYFIGEGWGGFVSFSPSTTTTATKAEPQQAIRAIGTNGCNSCVGVYIPIDKDTCFVAHIRAALDDERPGADEEDPDSVWAPNESEGAGLKKFFADHFRTIVDEHLETCQQNKDNTLIVCLNPTHKKPGAATFGRKFVGHYIIQALCEVLGREHEDDMMDGFVVDHEKEACYELTWDNSAGDFISPEACGFRRVTERASGLEERWNLWYADGEWQELDVSQPVFELLQRIGG